jgi:choline dehydrogenase-like flavoprotein
VKRLKKVLRKLGCIVPPGMVHTRPMGASVHYAGTLPMSVESRPMTVSPECRSHDFSNLYIADGATFPFLPAKNITFTLMANASRISADISR